MQEELHKLFATMIGVTSTLLQNSMIKSIIIGVSVYVITHAIQYIAIKVLNKFSK